MAEDFTEQALGRLTTAGLLEAFSGMDAPAVQEMDGEYAARLLAQPNALAVLTGHGCVSNPLMRWSCKGFRPVDGDGGRGYNAFTGLGRLRGRYPMRTLIAPSRYDGRPAYTLIYRAFHSACGTLHMVDEVRRAAPGVYLGMGIWGFTDRQRCLPRPFLLTGPTAPYRQDVGRPRAGFVPGLRELPATTPDPLRTETDSR